MKFPFQQLHCNVARYGHIYRVSKRKQTLVTGGGGYSFRISNGREIYVKNQSHNSLSTPNVNDLRSGIFTEKQQYCTARCLSVKYNEFYYFNTFHDNSRGTNDRSSSRRIPYRFVTLLVTISFVNTFNNNCCLLESTKYC